MEKMTMRRQILFLLIVLFSCCSLPSAQGQNCQGSETVSVPLKSESIAVQKIGDAVLFGAGMAIDADGAPNAYGPHNSGLDLTDNAKSCDKKTKKCRWVGLTTDDKGNPVTQKTGPYQGYYVSPTSLRAARGDASNPSTYVDATRIPYIALPPEFVKQFGIVLGDLAVVVNEANGKSAYAIYADVGPHGKIGEGSIALATALGFEHANPRHDGVNEGIRFLVFPKSGLGQGTLRTLEEISKLGEQLFHGWGGTGRMTACSPGAASTDLSGDEFLRRACAGAHPGGIFWSAAGCDEIGSPDKKKKKKK